MGLERVTKVSKHAIKRIEERAVPAELVAKAVFEGSRLFLPMRGVILHKLYTHIDGKKVCVVVVSGKNGTIVTSYIRKCKQ